MASDSKEQHSRQPGIPTILQLINQYHEHNAKGAQIYQQLIRELDGLGLNPALRSRLEREILAHTTLVSSSWQSTHPLGAESTSSQVAQILTGAAVPHPSQYIGTNIEPAPTARIEDVPSTSSATSPILQSSHVPPPTTPGVPSAQRIHAVPSSSRPPSIPRTHPSQPVNGPIPQQKVMPPDEPDPPQVQVRSTFSAPKPADHLPSGEQEFFHKHQPTADQTLEFQRQVEVYTAGGPPGAVLDLPKMNRVAPRRLLKLQDCSIVLQERGPQGAWVNTPTMSDTLKRYSSISRSYWRARLSSQHVRQPLPQPYNVLSTAQRIPVASAAPIVPQSTLVEPPKIPPPIPIQATVQMQQVNVPALQPGFIHPVPRPPTQAPSKTINNPFLPQHAPGQHIIHPQNQPVNQPKPVLPQASHSPLLTRPHTVHHPLPFPSQAPQSTSNSTLTPPIPSNTVDRKPRDADIPFLARDILRACGKPLPITRPRKRRRTLSGTEGQASVQSKISRVAPLLSDVPLLSPQPTEQFSDALVSSPIVTFREVPETRSDDIPSRPKEIIDVDNLGDSGSPQERHALPEVKKDAEQESVTRPPIEQIPLNTSSRPTLEPVTLSPQPSPLVSTQPTPVSSPPPIAMQPRISPKLPSPPQSPIVLSEDESTSNGSSPRPTKRRAYSFAGVAVPAPPKWVLSAQRRAKRRFQQHETNDPLKVFEDSLDNVERTVFDASWTGLRERPCRWRDCTAVLNSGQSLGRHLKCHIPTNTRKACCQWEGCSYIESGGEGFATHILTHATTPLFCAHRGCDENFDSLRHLSVHINTEHGFNYRKRPPPIPQPLTDQPHPPRLKPILPSYLVESQPVQKAKLSVEEHNIKGPWVLRQIVGRVEYALDATIAGVKRKDPVVMETPNLHREYDFLSYPEKVYDNNPRRKRVSDVYADIPSAEATISISGGLILFPSATGNCGEVNGRSTGTKGHVGSTHTDVELFST